MLRTALETEINHVLERYQNVRDEAGRRRVVRNGCLPKRTILTGAGPLPVQQPRIRDRRGGDEAIRFTSSILPPYLRRSKALDELIPVLYLLGISTGDFGEALEALVGPSAKGLSSDVVVGLKETWAKEYEEWNRRSLEGKEYVYLWADGVYFNIRLEEERQCILVVMGATRDGKKELVAVTDGYRESKESWREMLIDVKERGLKVSPKLAIADGALGFWAALREVYPATREQRCWVHKTANLLDKMAKSVQSKAKKALHEIWMAPSRQVAEQAFDRFVAMYEAKYPKAAACLKEDRVELLAFYDFPAEHWRHLRTTNPIESTFATVAHRHRKTKGNGSRRACLAMVFRLCRAAESHWNKLNGHHLIAKVFEGVRFVDGIMQEAA